MRRVFSRDADPLWTTDLNDIQSFSEANKGYRCIQMIIDVFSKYGWAIPLKIKLPRSDKGISKFMEETKPTSKSMYR